MINTISLEGKGINRDKDKDSLQLQWMALIRKSEKRNGKIIKTKYKGSDTTIDVFPNTDNIEESYDIE